MDYTATSSSIEYHEGLAKNTFGKILKDPKYKPATDFRFDITAKAICVNSKQTGYMLKVYTFILFLFYSC